MYSEILATIRTDLDRDLLLGEIEAMKKALFSSSEQGLEDALKNQVRASTALFVRNQIGKGEDAEAYLNGLGEAINKLPEVKLTLSFEPSEAILITIYNWLSTNVSKLIVMNIEVNPKILGGVIISYAGKYYDGSLEKVVEAALVAQKQQIIQVAAGSST